jgi:hypothetical protein
LAGQLVVVFTDFAERELKLLLSSAFCEWEPSAEWVARDNADEISPARGKDEALRKIASPFQQQSFAK